MDGPEEDLKACSLETALSQGKNQILTHGTKRCQGGGLLLVSGAPGNCPDRQMEGWMIKHSAQILRSFDKVGGGSRWRWRERELSTLGFSLPRAGFFLLRAGFALVHFQWCIRSLRASWLVDIDRKLAAFRHILSSFCDMSHKPAPLVRSTVLVVSRCLSFEMWWVTEGLRKVCMFYALYIKEDVVQ